MTYKQIVDAVLADGFAEAKRASAQLWVQARHAWLWDLEEWTFKEASATVTFTAGSMVAASVPSDFRTAIGLYDAQGAPLQPYEDRAEFYDRYNANLGLGSGRPEAFTVVAGQLIVGPAGDGTTGLLLYEKSKPALSADGDPTGLPEGYDLALVHGGKAEGFKLSNVPLWQGFDDDFTAFANAMRRNYLTGLRASTMKQLGAYRPGG
jgi:hypothetical protein